MAQLIKINDCISRYERDIYLYPSRFIRLKQENWQKLYHLWEKQKSEMSGKPVEKDNEKPTSMLGKVMSLMANQKKESAEGDGESKKIILPETEVALRKYFLDKLFPFQLKWATSTIGEISFLNKLYDHDQTLRYFLQRLPDIYLIMYYPTFHIRNATVDAQIILISPLSIELIYLIEDHPQSSVVVSNERTWTIESNESQRTVLSPIIGLKRTEKIVQSILHTFHLDYMINKTVLSRTNSILFSAEPYKTNIIGRMEYKDWLKKKRKLSSPLKSDQLKVADALLRNCITNAVKRPEWEERVEPFSFSPDSFS